MKQKPNYEKYVRMIHSNEKHRTGTHRAQKTENMSYATSGKNELRSPSDENQTPTIQSSSFTFEVLDGIIRLLLATEH